MNVFSPEFLALFLIAVAVLTFMARRKREPVILKGKQIVLRGKRLMAYLSPEAPLSCLLDDGKIFGEDFQDKQAPALPHEETCQCKLEDYVRDSQAVFAGKHGAAAPHSSDLGELDDQKARYYRFMLLASHVDATDEFKAEHLDLAANVKIDEIFSQHVKSHLKLNSRQEKNQEQS